MRRLKRVIGAAALTLAMSMVFGCSSSSERLGRLFDEYWQARLKASPTFATSIGEHRYDDRLDDLSADAVHAWRDEEMAFLRRAEDIDEDHLTADEHLGLAILKRQLDDSILEASCNLYMTPLSQQNGPQVQFPLLTIDHPFRNEQDYRNYAQRLTAFPRQVDQVVENCRAGMASGYVAPRMIVELVVPQVRGQIVPVDQSEFMEPTRRFPESVSAESRQELTVAIAEAIDASVVPAFRKLLTFIESEYLPACRETLGIYDVPNGEAIYDKLVRVHTTTDLSVDEIHRIGLEEIARIRGEMAQVAREMGFAGDVGEFITYMRNNPEYRAESAEALLEGFRAILVRTVERMPELFGRLPRARCEVKEIEAFRAPTSAAAYAWPPPADGSHPGYFYVNTYRATERPTYTMESLTYHEAYPGHILQISLDRENPDLPEFQRFGDFTAYIEGWALYSEGLGGEIGGYQDAASRFGRLTYDAWRAARLVVDTGIHRYKWSRARAVEYMQQNTGLSDVNIESEVDRYIAWPGQALAYKIGERTIKAIRADAEARLGDAFDIRAFHDALLAKGAQPLSVLQRRMADWIAMQADRDD